MASVVISGDTSGSVTLSAPAVAGTTTLTLPTVSGTVAVSGDTPSFAGITDTGNLTFTGTGNRITGDFSNATLANRVAFQSSTTNGATVVTAIPNGSSTQSFFAVHNSSDITNSSLGYIAATGLDIRILSTSTGTGTNLPLTFLTGGSERMRIDTSGNVGIGNTTVRNKLDVVGNTGIYSTGATSVGSPLGAQVYIGDSNYNTTSYYNAAPGFGAVYDATYASAAALAFYTYAGTPNARSERMRIDSSGNVGIGAASPTSTTKFYVEQSAGNVLGYFNSTAASQNARVRINSTDTASSVAYVWSYSNASLNKQASIYLTNTGALATQVGQTAGAEPTAGTTAMVIDSSGNVGIGTSSPADNLHVYANSTTENGIRVQNANASGQSAVQYYNNAGTQKADVWWNNNGSTFNIRTLSTDPLIFYTNNTERMRFDGSGNLLVGTTSQYSGAKNNFYRSGAGQIISVVTSVNSGNNDMMAFLDGDSNVCGYIQANTTANTLSYVTSSDYRLKQNIQPMTDGLAKVMQLKPSTWNWKSAPEVSGQGFIAHELQEVVPDAVCGEKDELDADNNPKYQGVDTSFLVATLTAAIQEQQALIQQLQADMEILKGKA